MAYRVIRQSELPGIPVRDMMCGQVGEIVLWSGNPDKRRGQVVQRHEGKLIIIGEPEGSSLSLVQDADRCRVRLLRPGDKIVASEPM